MKILETKKLTIISLALLTALGACATKPKTNDSAVVAAPTTTEANSVTSAPITAPSDSDMNGGYSASAELVAKVNNEIVIAGERVYFDTDSYTLSTDARAILSKQAKVLQKYPKVKVLVDGNADERGTREYNLALGARRAGAVKDYLVSLGINSNQIDTVSYGKERPIDERSNADGWAKNRNAHTAAQQN